MKDLLLIPVILAVLVLGYWIMTRVDLFVEESQRRLTEENRKGKSQVRIAAENPLLLEAVAAALESCSEADPHLAFFLSSGTAARIMEKLSDEQIDIVLLADGSGDFSEEEFSFLRIPCEESDGMVRMFGLPVERPDRDTVIRVVWKKERKERNRDRVIFALENEYCRLKSGYADYLN